MNNIAVVSPSEYLARFGAASKTDRRSEIFTRHVAPRRVPASPEAARPSSRSRSAAGTARFSKTGVVVAGIAIAATAASYGASLAWVLWFVRESGADFMQQLVGQIG